MQNTLAFDVEDHFNLTKTEPMESERATYFSFPKRTDAQRLRQEGHRLL